MVIDAVPKTGEFAPVPTGISPLARALCVGYWGRHWLRGILVLASLALGVAAWSATRALNRGANEAGEQAVAPLGGQADLCVSNDDSGIPWGWADQFRAVPGVRQVRPLILRNVRITEQRAVSARLLGVDFAQEMESKVALSPDASANMVKARLLGQTPVLVGRGLAADIGAHSGPTDLLIDGQNFRPTIVGTIDNAPGPAAALAGHVLVMSLGHPSTLLRPP